MPEHLPKLVELLLSKTPDVYKPAVAHAIFPPPATATKFLGWFIHILARSCHIYLNNFLTSYLTSILHSLGCFLADSAATLGSCRSLEHILADSR